MRRKVTKAIFPVAGLGTRFLPATKSVPKEIMTLVDRPLVQYAIDEARAAGIKEFIFVTSRGKSALEDYFDNAPQLEQELRRKGKDELPEILKATNMDSGEIAYMRQHKPLGLGHAVWCARRFIANEPFAVILPDDVIAAETPCLSQMVEAFEETQGNIVAAMEVPEALNYLTTTTLANARERGSIGELGGLADAAAERGHHAGAAVAIAAYIRFVQGRTDEVLEALDRLDGEELSDDAGHSIVIAYWAEIAAGLGASAQRSEDGYGIRILFREWTQRA